MKPLVFASVVGLQLNSPKYSFTTNHQAQGSSPVSSLLLISNYNELQTMKWFFAVVVIRRLRLLLPTTLSIFQFPCYYSYWLLVCQRRAANAQSHNNGDSGPASHSRLVFFSASGLATHVKQRPTYNTIEAPHRYNVQGSDTTMITRAASLPGQ